MISSGAVYFELKLAYYWYSRLDFLYLLQLACLALAIYLCYVFVFSGHAQSMATLGLCIQEEERDIKSID